MIKRNNRFKKYIQTKVNHLQLEQNNNEKLTNELVKTLKLPVYITLWVYYAILNLFILFVYRWPINLLSPEVDPNIHHESCYRLIRELQDKIPKINSYSSTNKLIDQLIAHIQLVETKIKKITDEFVFPSYNYEELYYITIICITIMIVGAMLLFIYKTRSAYVILISIPTETPEIPSLQIIISLTIIIIIGLTLHTYVNPQQLMKILETQQNFNRVITIIVLYRHWLITLVTVSSLSFLWILVQSVNYSITTNYAISNEFQLVENFYVEFLEILSNSDDLDPIIIEQLKELIQHLNLINQKILTLNQQLLTEIKPANQLSLELIVGRRIVTYAICFSLLSFYYFVRYKIIK